MILKKAKEYHSNYVAIYDFVPYFSLSDFEYGKILNLHYVFFQSLLDSCGGSGNLPF